jgi:serine/threonine protein kinase
MGAYPDFSAQGFQVIQELGRNPGGGRVTYLAQVLPGNVLGLDPGQIDRVVIKQFQFARGNSWGGYQEIDRESQALKDLQHSGIPRYLGTVEADNGFCLVQEYKRATPLSTPRSFTPEDLKEITSNLLGILIYLQDRIPPVFHRDIKPGNILVSDSLEVYLVDFGFAQIGNQSNSSIAGTLNFMPPEQVRNQPLTKACDLYGLGLTLVCTIAGLAPQDIGQYLDASNQLDRKAIASNLKVCSSSFTQWLHQMIAPDLKQRFPDAKTAWDALQPLSIRPDPTNQGRRKFMLSLAIGGGSLIAASLGWLLKPTTTGNITNPEEEFSPPDLTDPLLPYLNLNTRWNSYDLDNFLSHLDESRQQILISCLEKVSEFNVETINAEVVRLSSSFIGYRFQDKQHFDYHDFVEDVAKSYDINLEIIESKNTFQLERMILEEAFADFWDQLDSSGREELLTAIDETQELGKNLSSTGLVMLSGSAVLASLSATINLSGFAFYTTMSIAIHGIASALGIALPFAVYTGSSSLFAFLAGLPGLILMAMGAVGGALTLGLSNNVKRLVVFICLVHLIKVDALEKSGKLETVLQKMDLDSLNNPDPMPSPIA